jgi:PmbA protein
MNALLDAARKKADQAELYWADEKLVDVLYRDYRLDRVNLSELSSVSLRVIADGRLGVAYGVTPQQEGLLDAAVDAAAHGQAVDFGFAPAADYPEVRNADERTRQQTSAELVGVCEAIKQRIQAKRPDISLMIRAQARAINRTVGTSHGADGVHASTASTVGFGAPIKGAGTGIYKSAFAVEPLRDVDALVDEFLTWYGWTATSSVPRTGHLPVILAPEAAFLFTIPLCAGISGASVARKTSPVFDRLDEPILGDALTVRDEPLRDGDPSSRPFDDEGVACWPRCLVEAGVLRGRLTDQYSAAKLGEDSSGNGYKRELFRSGTEVPVNTWPTHLTIDAGERPLSALLQEMDEGILLIGGMGFHSGNYPQGQFAVQAVGFHVVNGAVVGRLERTMVAGNIYQDFLDAELSIERRAVDSLGGPLLVPYIRASALQVAGDGGD